MARMVFPRRWPALLALLLVTSCGGNTSQPGSGASQPAPSSGAEPVARFLSDVRDARYSDYANTQVASEQEFETMRKYVLDRYNTAPVTRSYLVGDATIDCMGPANSQTTDEHCPPGTVPVRRVTLKDLTRFPTLQGYLAKDPGGGGLPPIPPPTS
jgi:hypothetical protein